MPISTLCMKRFRSIDTLQEQWSFVVADLSLTWLPLPPPPQSDVLYNPEVVSYAVQGIPSCVSCTWNVTYTNDDHDILSRAYNFTTNASGERGGRRERRGREGR